MTADHATALREAVNVIMHYQFSHTRDAMHALQTLIDAAENAAYEIDRLRDTIALQQRSYEREIVLEVAAAREVLERPNDELCAENEQLRAEIADAVHTMRAYARENPRHEYQGATQDPNGVHAWLERNDRA